MLEGPEPSWRKQTACVLCRRTKTKCVYSEDDPSRCIRCQRGNYQCVVASSARIRSNNSRQSGKANERRKQRLANGSTPSTDSTGFPRAAIYSPNITTVGSELYNELIKVNNAASDQQELTVIIAKAKYMKALLAASDPVPELDWRTLVPECEDYLGLAIDARLLTRQDAEKAFELFRTGISPYVFCKILDDTETDLDSFRKRQPLVSLAVVIYSLIELGYIDAASEEMLTEFLERCVAENMNIRVTDKLEVAKCFTLGVMLQHRKGKRLGRKYFHAFCALGVCSALRAGTVEDFELASPENSVENNPACAQAVDRLSSYIGISATVAPLAIVRNNFHILDAMINLETCCQAVMKRSDYKLSHVVQFARLMATFQRSLTKLSEVPDEELQQFFESKVEKMRNAITILERSVPDQSPGRIVAKVVVINPWLCLVFFYEQMLARLFAREQEQNKSSTEDISRLLMGIKDICNGLLRETLDIVGQSTIWVPRYLVFKPLQAMISLVRAHMFARRMKLTDVIETHPTWEEVAGYREEISDMISSSSSGWVTDDHNVGLMLRLVDKLIMPDASLSGAKTSKYLVDDDSRQILLKHFTKLSYPEKSRDPATVEQMESNVRGEASPETAVSKEPKSDSRSSPLAFHEMSAFLSSINHNEPSGNTIRTKPEIGSASTMSSPSMAGGDYMSWFDESNDLTNGVLGDGDFLQAFLQGSLTGQNTYTAFNGL